MQSILKLGLYSSILFFSISLSAQLTVTSGTSLIVTSSETVTILGDLDNAGNLTGKGTITVGGDFDNTGVLGIIIGPDETIHTTINVTGTSILGGSFTITNDAYVPSNEDEATIITSGSAIGSSFSNTDNNIWFANYNTPSLGDFTISYSGVLPVELLYFYGQLKNEEIILNWETVTELNNDGFELQKSKNAKTWQKIAFIKGKGTSVESALYAFIDEQPFNDINYYRLKQIDFDGAFVYSNIISVKNEVRILDLAVFPNPTRGAINFINPLHGQLTVRDVLGQIIWQQNNLSNRQYIDLSFLPAATYFLENIDLNGQSNSMKIIISKSY